MEAEGRFCTRRSTRVPRPVANVVKTGALEVRARLLQTGDERSILCFHRDERPKQGARAEFFDVSAEDPRKQRASDGFDDLLTEMAAHKSGYTLIGLGTAMQQGRIAKLGGARGLCFVGLFGCFTEER